MYKQTVNCSKQAALSTPKSKIAFFLLYLFFFFLVFFCKESESENEVVWRVSFLIFVFICELLYKRNKLREKDTKTAKLVAQVS